MLSKLAVRRLTKLADYMAKLPKSAEKHFDMWSWFYHSGSHSHGLKPAQTITERELNLCGTTACALGWAATMPFFRKLGLSLRADNQVCYRGRAGSALHAAEKVFDIQDLDQLAYLFGGSGEKTQKQWATRCREFIKENRA